MKKVRNFQDCGRFYKSEINTQCFKNERNWCKVEDICSEKNNTQRIGNKRKKLVSSWSCYLFMESQN